MMTGVVCGNTAWQVGLAVQVERLAAERWGGKRPTVIVGRHDAMAEALQRVARFAAAGGPVLLTGETGTGKELFARATYLFSPRRNRTFLTVNCAQYHDGQLMASELFGHKRGSFTGAVADHRGVFEEADGGVVFLDEVGELSIGAQAMLLRALSEGEVVPVGGTHAKGVDVQVIAATSRDLRPMIEAGTFRADLYYRLRYFHVHVPAVRERGDDWELVADYCVHALGQRASRTKRLSSEAKELLRGYHWPGNVREIKSVVDVGYHLSDAAEIEPAHFAHELEARARTEQLRRITIERDADDPVSRMARGEASFWEVVYRPFMAREMGRAEAREIVAEGLGRTRGSYKRLCGVFGVAQDDYLKFMDFLRHQNLKPVD